MPPLRVGNVRYLNAVPLVDGLEGPGFHLEADTPARVAERVGLGRLDLGLVPVVEAARLNLLALPGVGIVARSAARSVLLLARVPLDRVRRLALDPASRTSAVLAKLLLRDALGLDPAVVAGPAEGHPLPEGCDAALVIGDRALALDPADLIVTDLATWWHEHTGLPFVFALWAGADGDLLGAAAGDLVRARDRGLQRLDAIAEEQAGARGLTVPVAHSYLRDALSYHVGEREREGLHRFLEMLRRARLLPAAAALRFTEA